MSHRLEALPHQRHEEASAEDHELVQDLRSYATSSACLRDDWRSQHQVQSPRVSPVVEGLAIAGSKKLQGLDDLLGSAAPDANCFLTGF